MIKDLSLKLQELFTKDAKKLSYEKKFTQRKSKLTGEKFAKGMVFGWQGQPDSTFSDLTSTIADFGTEISEPGLFKRFTQSSADFMEALLKKAILILNGQSELNTGILSKFKDIQVYDSTMIMLPLELIELWTGCGGTKGPKENSSVKLSVRLSLKTGSLKLVIEDGFIQDKNSMLIVNDEIEPGSLSIKDLGYFSLKHFREISLKEGYYCSRLKTQTKIYSLSGKEIDIIRLMAGKTSIDQEVFVGKQEQLKCRLVIIRLPDELRKKRIEEMIKEAKREGKNISEKKLDLAAFNIFITNADHKKLSFQEVIIMMISRWQIELLFKLWKSYCKIDKSRSKKPFRVLTELYSKLLGAIISNQLMIIGMWQNIDRSMIKAIKIIQKNSSLLIHSFSKGTKALAQAIETICSKLHKCRKQKRAKKPSTPQFISGLKGLPYCLG